MKKPIFSLLISCCLLSPALQTVESVELAVCEENGELQSIEGLIQSLVSHGQTESGKIIAQMKNVHRTTLLSIDPLSPEFKKAEISLFTKQSYAALITIETYIKLVLDHAQKASKAVRDKVVQKDRESRLTEDSQVYFAELKEGEYGERATGECQLSDADVFAQIASEESILPYFLGAIEEILQNNSNLSAEALRCGREAAMGVLAPKFSRTYEKSLRHTVAKFLDFNISDTELEKQIYQIVELKVAHSIYQSARSSYWDRNPIEVMPKAIEKTFNALSTMEASAHRTSGNDRWVIKDKRQLFNHEKLANLSRYYRGIERPLEQKFTTSDRSLLEHNSGLCHWLCHWLYPWFQLIEVFYLGEISDSLPEHRPDYLELLSAPHGCCCIS